MTENPTFNDFDEVKDGVNRVPILEANNPFDILINQALKDGWVDTGERVGLERSREAIEEIIAQLEEGRRFFEGKTLNTTEAAVYRNAIDKISQYQDLLARLNEVVNTVPYTSMREQGLIQRWEAASEEDRARMFVRLVLQVEGLQSQMAEVLDRQSRTHIEFGEESDGSAEAAAPQSERRNYPEAITPLNFYARRFWRKVAHGGRATFEFFKDKIGRGGEAPIRHQQSQAVSELLSEAEYTMGDLGIAPPEIRLREILDLARLKGSLVDVQRPKIRAKIGGILLFMKHLGVISKFNDNYKVERSTGTGVMETRNNLWVAEAEENLRALVETFALLSLEKQTMIREYYRDSAEFFENVFGLGAPAAQPETTSAPTRPQTVEEYLVALGVDSADYSKQMADTHVVPEWLWEANKETVLKAVNAGTALSTEDLRWVMPILLKNWDDADVKQLLIDYLEKTRPAAVAPARTATLGTPAAGTTTGAPGSTPGEMPPAPPEANAEPEVESKESLKSLYGSVKAEVDALTDASARSEALRGIKTVPTRLTEALDIFGGVVAGNKDKANSYLRSATEANRERMMVVLTLARDIDLYEKHIRPALRRINPHSTLLAMETELASL